MFSLYYKVFRGSWFVEALISRDGSVLRNIGSVDDQTLIVIYTHDLPGQ